MKKTSLIPVILVGLLMLLSTFAGPALGPDLGTVGVSDDSAGGSSLVDIGNGETIEVAPGETLHKFVLTEQGWVEWQGDSTELIASEFGNSTTLQNTMQMTYLPTNVTTNVTVDIPTGNNWEAYQVRADLTEITENRTWVQNPDLTGSDTGWTRGTTDGGSYSSETSLYNSSGHGPGDGSFDFFIDSNSASSPFYYSGGDRAWAQQTMTAPRGQVVWAGFRTDYWADTRDDTHYGMTGAFSIYLTVESTWTWEKSFTEIGAEETWYDSGLVSIPTSTFNLPTDQSVTLEVGLWCKGTYGYAPNILPAAKFDNIELYLKTRATPTSLNLEMNGNPVTDNTGYGSGFIVETPTTPWITDPVRMNFTWSPTPINPVPNRTIIVEFDVNINMFARRLDFGTVKEINPTAFGERFSIQNGTDASYSTYFYADIPQGYANRYFFNMTIPANRDVYFVARPLAPSTNLTTGWNGGNPGDGFLNVSTYDVATEAGRYGYWRILSKSPNMISDIELYDPNALVWSRTIDLRAGNSTQIRANLGAAYANSVVNFTVYTPTGQKWYSVNATTDGSGYATTPWLTFDGANASAGSWMVQAFSNDVGTNTDWRSTGFFKRPFSVTHTSALTINYPDDAVGTWKTNVTYGDLLLIIITANDTDSQVVVPGGTLSMNWVLGSDTFDDSGNGQYTKVLDTSLLPGKGQYTIDLTWTANNFDTANAVLTVNVNYNAELTSPDYPGIQGPIGNDQTFIVEFKNVNGTGILGASIQTNWTNSYTVTEIGSGQYQIVLTTSGIVFGSYPVLISASASFVEPRSMLMFVEIREVYNTVSYSANQLSIPVGESASFTITWYDTDNDQPITGMASAITSNWTSFHTTGEQNYTVVETSPGVYNVTIFTEIDDPLTTPSNLYNVVFNVTRKDYQNHTFSIGVEIRRHNTQFVLDSPIEQTPIGQDIVVLVFYQDTDLLQGITNGSGFVDFDITSPDVTSLAFISSVSALGDGHYNITISSSQWSSIGWKNLTITASWTGGQTYYSQVLDTRVRLLGTETDLYLEIAPTATNYLDNFTFTLVYYDVVNATRISNSTNNVLISVIPITTGHSVTQADFVIAEIDTSGTYSFELNASLFGAARTFKFQIDFLWRKAINPLYENQTITVTLVVLGIPTYVDYTPIGSTPYGELADFSFSYVNSLTSEKISNSSNLYISIVGGGVPFTLLYDSVTMVFTMRIDTSALGVGTSSLTLNITWIGEPFYEEAFQDFSVTVTYRSTQLTHLSFAAPQWGQNVTIEFVYTDLVSGTSSGMTGILSFNLSLAAYTITSLGGGHYLAEINTTYFASAGLFYINATIIYDGSNFASDAIEIFELTIIERITQLGYETPDPTPYLNNVSFIVTYLDDSTSTPISGGSVVVYCSNSSSSLLINTNYWVSDLGTGEYLIEIDSTALGSVGVFVLQVNISRSGSPFYALASANVNSRVTQRTTQILITQTPGEVPFLELVVFKFRYTDFLTGISISITKAEITLTHGAGMTVIVSTDYTLTESGGIYTISFNSTILNPSALVTGHPIQMTIDASAGVPYYAPRSISTSVTTTERPTQILFPLVADTPYYENITINFEYIDFLTDSGIQGAIVTVSFLNMTSPTHYITDLGSGLYEIIVPTAQFGNTGTIYFNVSVSISGSPFYSARSASQIPAKIILIPTILIAEVPSVASQPVGQPILVNLTFTTTQDGSPISGAAITTDWVTLYSTDAIIQDLGSGAYRITINTTGLLAQEYVFTIQAELAFYVIANITVSVTPGDASAEIILASTTVYADWGDQLTIKIDVKDPLYGTYIPGMNATLYWNGSIYVFSDLLNWTYVTVVDTTDNDFGVSQPQITITKEFYQPKQTTMTFIISKAIGYVIPEQTFINIITNTTRQIWVYLNDTNRNQPITDAVITAEWNNTIYSMVTNGTPGYYVSNIDTVGFAIGQYELQVSAFHNNYDFLDLVVVVIVDPIPISLNLPNLATSIFSYYGEDLDLLLTLTDNLGGGLIRGANVTYALANITGSLTELPNGSYVATIDTSSLPAQSIYLKITFSKEYYETKIVRFLVNIQPIPTTVEVDLSSKAGYFGDTVVYVFSLNDSLHDVPLSGADVRASWDGGSGEVTDYGNGTYSVAVNLNVTTPKRYDVEVRFILQNYDTAYLKVRLDLNAFPVVVQGPRYISIPVNDSLVFYYNLNNTIVSEFVSDASGIANWVGLEQVVLDIAENGSYILEIPGDLDIGEYTIDLSFIKPLYQISPYQIIVTVRQVDTDLVLISHDSSLIQTLPGQTIELTISYLDIDHGRTIPDATITYTVTADNPDAVIYYPSFIRTIDEYGGTYVLYFVVEQGGIYDLTIQFSRGDYAAAAIDLQIDSNPTPEQVLVQNATYGIGSLLIIGAVLMYYYVRVWSIPVQIRALNRMIKELKKGKVPRPARAPTRQMTLLSIIQDELKPIGLVKEPDDVVGETIQAHVPEVNELLDRLAEITGLGAVEIEAFRADLAKMKASERPGFIREVIAQEEARRADTLAREREPEKPVETAALESRPEEVEEIRQKLLAKGLAPAEIEVILEEAKTLSKADLEALLNSLGIKME